MGHVTRNSKIGGYKLSPYTNYFYFTFSGLYAIGNKSGSHQHCIYEKGGRTKVIEHQYINQHLYQRTEYYEAVGNYSTLEQNPAPVTG